MRIDLSNLAATTITSLQTQAKQALDASTTYTNLEGQKITVPENAKCNIVVGKNGAVIPLMWDAGSGKFEAIFTSGSLPLDISRMDIESAAASFADGVSGNVVIASDNVKVNSNNTLIINSDGTSLTASDNSAVINSPHSALIESMYGIVKDSASFFGWFSHWIQAESSPRGSVLNSDEVPMLNSSGAMVDACEFASCNNSPGAMLRQSSYIQTTDSANAIAYEMNRAIIENSPNFTGANCNGTEVKNSANNGAINSSKSRIIDSPNRAVDEAKFTNAFHGEFKGVMDRKATHDELLVADDRLGEVFKAAIEKALIDANIKNSETADISGSPNITVQCSLEPKVHNSTDTEIIYADSVNVSGSNNTKIRYCSEVSVESSPGASVTDSTGSKIVNSPEVVLDNSMNLTVTNASPGTQYINQSQDSGEGSGDRIRFEDRLAAALKS